jgi:hypothetical protein
MKLCEKRQKPIFKNAKLGKEPPLKDLTLTNPKPDFEDSNANLKDKPILKTTQKVQCKHLPNGLRYLRVGGRGQCLGAGKTRSQKNA